MNRSRDWIWINEHPNTSTGELNRKAVRRIDSTFVQNWYPNMARPVYPCPGDAPPFIHESEFPAACLDTSNASSFTALNAFIYAG